MNVSQKQFEEIINEAVARTPKSYRDRLQNVAFLVEDKPTNEQRQKLKLSDGQTLLGLYEGVPLPQRNGATKVLPDKITLFKTPLLAASQNLNDLKQNVYHTVWHEIAHYFGLDHEQIHNLELPDNKKKEKE